MIVNKNREKWKTCDNWYNNNIMTSRTISQKNGSRVKTWSHTITSPCYYTSQIFYTRYKGLHRPPTLTNQSYLSLFETSRRVVVSWATVQKGQVDSTATISFSFFPLYLFVYPLFTPTYSTNFAHESYFKLNILLFKHLTSLRFTH